MADTETTVEKHYCYPCASSGDSSLNPMLSALLTNQNGMNNPMAMMAMNNNNQMNNPMWLVWMMAMKWMNGENNNGNNAQLAQLQGQVADNQSFNNMLSAITQNQNVINDIATRTQTSIDFVRESLGALGTAIQNVAGKTELSAEKVANAVVLGDANITSQMLQCCCQNKLLVTEQGYQNQLATERQTGIITSQMSAQHSADMLQDAQNQSALLSRVDALANGIQTGFAQIGYQSEKNTSAIIQAGNANTQRILDQMCANQTQALRDQIADKDRQLQTQTLLNQLGGCSCNS